MHKQTKISQVFWEDAKEADKLPRITMYVSFTKLILGVAATRDWFPSHHDPEYARRQGQKDIYMNTTMLAGFIDRVITDWAGPRAFIMRRKFSMQQSIFADDEIYAEGVVKGRRRDECGRGLVDVEVTVCSQNGVCAPASATVLLPSRQELV